MLKQAILIVSAVVCIGTVWYIRLQNPAFNLAPVITAAVLGVSLYVSYKTNKKCVKCVSATSSSGCELDSDCNKVDPGAQCYKNAAGECGCRCSHGYSGDTCQIKGIPWNDPGCMGPNKQSPKNTGPGDLCVCPNENWVGGTDSTYGQVQCLKCGGSGSDEWGPFAATGAPNACTAQWKQVNLLSDTCVFSQTTTPSLFCEDVATQYANTYKQYPNNQGDGPSVQLYSGYDPICVGQSCKCAGNTYQFKLPTARGLCTVTGWVQPGVTSQSCTDKSVNTERPCSSYDCKGWSG